MRILIIANPVVGIDKEKRAIIEKIVSHISSKGGNVDITYSLKHGMGGKYSSMSKFEGYDAVYAAGGDGIVNDVASGLVGRDIPLGIIPLGTGNGFARGLNIPLDTERLIEVLLQNKSTKIDTGKISGHFFFTTAGIGFDAKIAYDFNNLQKINRSLTTYFTIGIKNYFLTRPENLTLVIDGKEINRKVFGITIANSPQYGAGAVIAPQAGLKTGKLVAVLIPKINMLNAVTVIKKLFYGSVSELNQLEFIEFKTLIIKRKKAGLYHVDGDAYRGPATLKVTIIPSSLEVIVP